MTTLRHIRLLLTMAILGLAMASWFVATGLGATPGTTSFQVEVPSEVHISRCSSTVSLGNLVRGATVISTSPCNVTFGSQNAGTAMLRATDSSDVWGLQSPALDTLPDNPGTPGPLVIGFGMCMDTIGGTATAVIARSLSGCPDSDPNWYPLRNTTPRVIANSSSYSDGQVGVRFGVATAASTPPGLYQNTVTFEVLAP
jgi:hypothetical protein